MAKSTRFRSVVIIALPSDPRKRPKKPTAKTQKKGNAISHDRLDFREKGGTTTTSAVVPYFIFFF